MTSRKCAGPNRSSEYRQTLETECAFADQVDHALAFEELVSRYESRIYRLALRITQNKKDTEEVLQDSFIKAYEHLRELQTSSCFLHRLIRIAANEALHKLREKYSAELALEQAEQKDDNLVPTDVMDWGDNPTKRYKQRELNRMSEGVNALKPMSRSFLRDAEKWSTGEVADFLGLSRPAVASRLLQARLRMREHLNRYFRRQNDPVQIPLPCRRGRKGVRQ